MGSSLRRVCLVRHAESVWNEERRVQGMCRDVPLSPTGRMQAELLGRRLRRLELRSVYSSDAERAIETVRIALGNERPVAVSSEFRELSLGEWEGRLISDIREESPDMIERWYRKPSTVKLRDGENIHDFRRRVVTVMERITGEPASGDLLVVTHGGFICCYLTHIFGMDVDDMWSFSLPNASITTIVLDFRPRLRSFGDTSHLEGGVLGTDGMPAPL